jgi:hypothetical protein
VIWNSTESRSQNWSAHPVTPALHTGYPNVAMNDVSRTQTCSIQFWQVEAAVRDLLIQSVCWFAATCHVIFLSNSYVNSRSWFWVPRIKNHLSPTFGLTYERSSVFLGERALLLWKARTWFWLQSFYFDHDLGVDRWPKDIYVQTENGDRAYEHPKKNRNWRQEDRINFSCEVIFLSSYIHSRWYPSITYYWTLPLILDHSYLVGKLTSSKIADTKVSGF